MQSGVSDQSDYLMLTPHRCSNSDALGCRSCNRRGILLQREVDMSQSQPSDRMPVAPLAPGEEWKELIGNQSHSLGLTTHRVIRIIQNNTYTDSKAIFLDKIDNVRYSRETQWGYLAAAIFVLVLFSVLGFVLREVLVGFVIAGGLGVALGIGSSVILMINFLLSRKPRITITAGAENIQVTSDSVSVDQFLEFLFKVQAAVIERHPLPNETTA